MNFRGANPFRPPACMQTARLRAVQLNRTETKGKSLQIFVIYNYQKVGMKHRKVPFYTVLITRSCFQKLTMLKCSGTVNTATTAPD